MRSVALGTLVGLLLQSFVATGQESTSYLGRKLEYVLANVDNEYVEQHKAELAERHRKAFQKLGEYLERDYPNLEADLVLWLEENYPGSLREYPRESEEGNLSIDVFLWMDRRHEGFRRKLLSDLESRYPGLFGNIACFLRDNHLPTLREVLRVTLRMTSNVPSCPISGEDDAPEPDILAEPTPQPPSGGISMLP